MIPKEIIEMVTKLQSGRNDGWTEDGIRTKLIAIRDYINKVLADERQPR